MKAHRLLYDDYQKLLDRGWRRSGSYCYHPINMATCCPNYAISCKAVKFKLSRSQRKCIQNLNSYLVNGLETSEKVKLNYHSHKEQSIPDQVPDIKSDIVELKKSSKARDRRFVRGCERKASLLNISLDEAFSLVRKKHIDRRKVQQHILSLEDYLYPIKNKNPTSQVNEESQLRPKHSLEIHLYQVDSNKCKALLNDEHKIIQRYQHSVHKEGPEDWCKVRFSDFLIKSPIFVEPLKGFSYLDSDTESYESETCSKSVPLTSESDSSEYLLVKPPELPTCYGTYHCVYQLDGELIAVGVLDVLPKCITTVYFFYNPSYGHLNLGIYSALVEISMVRQMNSKFIATETENTLVHYYLGFYVHECLKMRYKTTFKPSYLLCSETCKYVPTDICLSKLTDGIKYARFSDDPEDAGFSIYTQNPATQDIFTIPIASPVVESDQMADYIAWSQANLGAEATRKLFHTALVQYARLIGSSLVPKMRLLLR